MARLEELGLLAAPHTSAGRIPTEAGYRYFVRSLMANPDHDLSAADKHLIRQDFERTPSDLAMWLRTAATTLARTTRSATMVTAPRAPASYFKHLALLATHGRMVMMVLVMQSGDVRQQMFTLAESYTQDHLSAATNKLNTMCAGLDADQLQALIPSFESDLEREVFDLVVEALRDLDPLAANAYRGGLSDALFEFPDSQSAQQAVRLIEGQRGLEPIMDEAAEQPIGEVRVLIAGDGRWEAIRHLSVVLSRYGVSGRAVGTLIVIGPTRMRYGRAISAAGYVSGMITNLMLGVYGVGEE